LKSLSSSHFKVWTPWIFLVVAGFFQWQVYDSSSKALEKESQARELAHASYGLLNPVTWIEEAGTYLEERIDGWELTPEQSRYWGEVVREEAMEPLDRFFREEVVKKGLPKLLEEGKGGSLLNGLLGERFSASVQAAVANSYEDVIRPALGELVEEMVVQVTRAVGTWLNRPETKAWLKKGLREQVEILKGNSGIQEAHSPAIKIQQAYGCEEGLSGEKRQACAQVLLSLAAEENGRARSYSLMGGIALGLVVFWALFFGGGQGVFPLLGSMVLLWLAGISLPMLSVEARIQELDVLVGGKTLHFEDNILFYQSKSVLGFVWILLSGGQIQTILVGLLVGLFSVLFPMAKLVGMAWLKGRDTPAPGWVKALVVHSGKWSMADVFVVALFMGYLGFGRMIQTQVDGIGAGTSSVQAVATDGTQLEFGFFYFLAFCLVSIASSRLFSPTAKQGETT